MRTKRLSVRLAYTALGFAAALILAGTMGSLAPALANRLAFANPAPTLTIAAPQPSNPAAGFTATVRRVLPSVVNVSTLKVVQTSDNGWPFETPRTRKAHALGSGVIISPEGYILTNNHVVEGASTVSVTLSDKREYSAKIVGTDPKTDIAVLRIDAPTLPALTLGNSDRVEVGEFALAIGNPFGLGQTVTMGIVSATGRGGLGIEDYEDFIQTDAAINPGNSGGALIDERGELIGINTAILSQAGGNQGVGFAVPINLARHVMDEIVKDGKVTRSYMGVMSQDLTPAMATALGTGNTDGALISDVEPEGPAAQAGIQRGDVVRALDGQAITGSNQLRLKVSMMHPSTTVKLTLLRNGKPRSVEVRLEQMPTQQS